MMCMIKMGLQNVVADALSRIELPINNSELDSKQMLTIRE